MELSGMLMLRISDENFGKVKLQLQTPSKSAIQIQPHPNIDKELLRARSQIAMKNPAKPFPTNTDVGVLKWRFQTTDDSLIPLSSKLSRNYIIGRHKFRIQTIHRNETSV